MVKKRSMVKCWFTMINEAFLFQQLTHSDLFLQSIFLFLMVVSAVDSTDDHFNALFSAEKLQGTQGTAVRSDRLASGFGATDETQSESEEAGLELCQQVPWRLAR